MSKGAIRIKGFSELENDKICYYKTTKGWMLYFPKCGLGNLAQHDVTEHEDGTITVSPSILIEGHDNGEKTQIHGYLKKGVWEDC